MDALAVGRDLGLGIAAQKLFEFNKTVQEIERQRRTKHAILAPAHSCRRFKDGQAGLLERYVRCVANFGDVLGALPARNSETANADVAKLMQARTQANSR